MAKKGLYRGYSSFEFQKNKSFKLRDLELVKMDLLNHLFTRRGERVMMPRFGTEIPDLLFEPLTTELVELCREEVLRVINYDPRVELMQLEVRPNFDANAITVAARLFYIELDTVDDFELNLEFEG
jgi:phage baseplate assembly protein W